MRYTGQLAMNNKQEMYETDLSFDGEHSTEKHFHEKIIIVQSLKIMGVHRESFAGSRNAAPMNKSCPKIVASEGPILRYYEVLILIPRERKLFRFSLTLLISALSECNVYSAFYRDV